MQLCAGARPEPSTKGGDSRGWDPSSPEEAPCTPAGARVAPRGPHVCISPAAPVCPKRGPGHSPPRGWHPPTSLSFRQAPAPPPRACHMGGAWWTLTKAGQTPSGGQRLFGCWPWQGGGGGTGALSPHHRPLVPRMERGVQSPRGGPRSPLLPLKPRPAPSPVSNINRSSLKQGLLFNPK